MSQNDPYIITGEEALHLLELVVKEHGEDFVYQRPSDSRFSCVYMYNGQPSCIVGHVFADQIGIPVPLRMENVTPSGSLFEVPGVVLTEEGAAVLDAAQAQQDVGKTWGVALDAAREAGE
jgi:hypothetical protein